MKVRQALANALDFEMRTSRDLRLQLVVREASMKHLQVVMKERDDLLTKVTHLEERIRALTEVT